MIELDIKCVLDFYILKEFRRKGYGYKIYKYMLND